MSIDVRFLFLKSIKLKQTQTASLFEAAISRQLISNIKLVVWLRWIKIVSNPIWRPLVKSINKFTQRRGQMRSAYLLIKKQSSLPVTDNGTGRIGSPCLTQWPSETSEIKKNVKTLYWEISLLATVDFQNWLNKFIKRYLFSIDPFNIKGFVILR